MNQDRPQAAFDKWAQTYDRDVGSPSDDFPFAGYRRVLKTVFYEARASAGMSLLDIGVGTGNLSKYFVDAGCHVVGADFSSEMLVRAAAKAPGLAPVQVDMTSVEWPASLDGPFDRIVSNYVFHEFPFDVKMSILSRLADGRLKPGGYVVIGDVAFTDRAALAKAREEAGELWEEEYYWLLDETRAALQSAGWQVAYTQISFCAGVYVLHPPAP